MADDDAHRWRGGRVQCPACGREAYTDHRANLCQCGYWFGVFETVNGTVTELVDGPDEVLGEA